MLLFDAADDDVARARVRPGLVRVLAGIVGLSVAAGIAVSAALTPAVLTATAASSRTMTFFDDLPHDLRIERPMAGSTMYATRPDGSAVELASFSEQNRIPVAFDQVSPTVYDALISSEDKDFATHGGVNLLSTAKAIAENVLGASSRGASTITQQYVKNVLIQRCEQKADATSPTYEKDLEACWLEAANTSGEDGLERKLQEMRYAVQLEKELTKKEILIGYLNLVNFGGGAYGVEVAARYYFSATAETLTLAQAATLAGMVQNPSRYRIDRPRGTRESADGVRHNSAADGYADTRKRRDYVLSRMLEDGRISRAQYAEAKAAPVAPLITPQTNGCRAAGENAYYCEYVRTALESDPAFGATQKQRTERLRRGGLKIYTSLDPVLQDAAAQTMQGATDPARVGAAAVAVEVQTGRLLALAQNTPFTDVATDDPAATSLVFAADAGHGGSAGFPAGPSAELFAVIDRLEQRRPSPERSGRAPHGVERVAERLGAALADTPPDAPAGTLESRPIAPLAMASAYAAIANGGMACPLHAIDRILDGGGKEVPLPGSACVQAVSPSVAADAVRALGDRTVRDSSGHALIGRAGSYGSWPALRVEAGSEIATATWAGSWRGAPSGTTAAQDRRDATALRDLLATRLQVIGAQRRGGAAPSG